VVTPGRSASAEFAEMTVPELQRVKRDLRACLGLLVPGSPAVIPVTGELTAIDAELARREGSSSPGPVSGR
jgi:hypothetical protein